jgi:arginyl-tRNA synthetase
MNIFSIVLDAVHAAVSSLQAEGKLPTGLELAKVTAEPPRDASHGDVATNVAMVLAKPAGMNPRAVAELIVTKLKAMPNVKSVAIAGPGFINIAFETSVWPELVSAILTKAENFGSSKMGQGERVNVEYVSANPTGPLHVGHCRGAVFGDALATLLEFAGYDVTREYYINDAGAQVDVLARSVLLRYREALGEDIGEIPEGLYPGDYLVPVGQALAKEFGATLLGMPENQWLPLVRDKTIDMMMDLIRDDLATLNIRQTVFTSEKSLHDSGAVADILEKLEARGLIYKGKLPPPKGEVDEDWEDREQTLFRTTSHGDDTDRPLKKADGTYTYFASDVAYSADKIARGFKQLIYVLGADHGGYVKRLQAVGAAVAGNQSVEVDAKLCQLVKLYRDGEPFRMSKRAGNFVTLRDVVEEVGSDVVRFIMLYRKNEAPLDFDFAKVTEQSKDNPVFYVQYAHARICSVLRNAQADENIAKFIENPDLTLLADPAEFGVCRRLGEFPRLIEAAAQAHEPHRVAFYLYDLASDYHALWNMGKDQPHLRFINADQPGLTAARLAFLRAIRYCLANGLRILGVTPIHEM